MLIMSEDYWIEYWKKKREIRVRIGKGPDISEDVVRHKASLVLGRDFGEDMDSYLKRKNLKKYMDWKP
jgi:hypothetical protein